jgi:threonine dehydratase
MNELLIPVYQDIVDAHRRILPYIHQTPVFTSSGLNDMLGTEVFFKCENFQKVGAFKFRGAVNAVMSLSDAESCKGVATHSSGNHAAALALAARIRKIKAYIVMPDNAPDTKKQAVASYGGEITFCAPTLAARESTLEQAVIRTGATVIHPYNNFLVISGQGTAAKELLEEVPFLDTILVPVGGGGLLSGTAIAAKTISPKIRVIAAEPEMANDAYQSFCKGSIVPSNNPKTIADGLLTSLGSLTFKAIQTHVDDIVTVSEELIVVAMRLIWQRMKIIIEPSSAVPVAALIQYPEMFRNKKIGIILSGGNVDLDKLPFTLSK